MSEVLKQKLMVLFISITLLFAFIGFLVLNQSLAWFSENKEVTADGLSLNAKVSPNLIIASSEEDIQNDKKFDFSIDFAYQIGGQVYDGDYAGYMASPTSSSKGSNFHADVLDAWTKDNNTNIPRFQFDDQYSSATSDRFLTDASYLSLNNINFGYTFDKMLTKKIGVERLRLYVAADNIWVWSKRQGLDPRQSITGSSTNSYYAPIRTISGGVTLTF